LLVVAGAVVGAGVFVGLSLLPPPQAANVNIITRAITAHITLMMAFISASSLY
jgi:hypothetical protein